MGFLDKAKKLADQAQTKIDEVQKDFNAKQGGAGTTGPAVEYDQHGRPVSAAPPAQTPAPPAPADKGPTIDPGTPTSADPAPAQQHGDPLAADEPGSRQGPAPSKPPAPPSGGSGMSSGDPLAG